MVLIVFNSNQDFLDFQGFGKSFGFCCLRRSPICAVSSLSRGYETVRGANRIRSTIIFSSLLGFLIQRDDIDAITYKNQGRRSWGVR
jgi:hypothetical protein